MTRAAAACAHAGNGARHHGSRGCSTGAGNWNPSAAAGGVQRLERHDAGFPHHPGNTKAVVGGRTNDAAQRGAVPVVVTDVVCIIDEVPAEGIIFITVAVIILVLVAIQFSLIFPEVRVKIGMAHFDTSINHSDDHLA